MIIVLRGLISVLMAVFYFTSIVSAQTSESISAGKNTGNITSNIQEGKNENNSISEHAPTNQSYDIRVALDHIFISKKNNSLEISETVVFRNEGQEINFNKDNHTFFAISTPPNIRNLKTQAMECCLVQDKGVVYMDPMQPIAPGANFEMQISYTLPWSSEYMFNKSAVYNTTSILIFIDKKSGISLEGRSEVMTLSGNEYNVITFNNLKVGETVSIQVKILQESNYLYAGIGLFSIFSIGLVYQFRRKIFRRRKKEFTLEELESEKRKIFKKIYGFEKHAGPERSEELRKLIEEYRLKAIQVFIKIDKLKDKGQYELLEKGMKQN
ncbi:MAG: hypothetical protein FIB07_09365 [Candidatus Methanoperedens sp.]|nr:hypothetical protein [Candidatus Methanoperedens sp.]